MNRNAYLFPGQGSQFPGMGKDFAMSFLTAREVFEEADEILKEHISRIIFEGPEELLTQTKYSQVGIFVTSAAILKTVQTQIPDLAPTLCAGLSLGEYTALYASGRLSFQETLRLVHERARLMNEACEKIAGKMVAVLGFENRELEEAVKGRNDIWIANYNCPGQIILSGTIEGIEEVTPYLKTKGAKRILPLTVHGAFHSGLMQSAQEGLAPLIERANIQASDVGFVMNVSGNFVRDREEVRRNLVQQVTRSVRWEQGIQVMMGESDLFLEIGCGTTLTGLNKKIGVSVPTFSVGKVEDLDRIGEMLCSNC